jgi:EmrB/QacA subfamily drug resistance transporter
MNPDAPELEHREVLTIIGGLMLGMLVAALSQTVVGTALPTIVGELGGQDKLSWVVTATLLTSTASTPLWGKLSDLYGRKRMFLSSITIFLIASVLCGLSQSIWMLIAFRAAQGVGTGGLMALSQAIIGDIVPPRERGRYQGYMGSVWAASSVGGPLLGGFLVDTLSWRWCFFVAVPVGLAALVVTNRVLQMPVRRVEHRVDYAGAALLVGAVTAVLSLTSMGGRSMGWTSPLIVGLGLVAIGMLAVFISVERQASEPILPLRLFSNRIFTIATAASFIVGLAMFGAMTFLPQYLQIARGASPTASGLLMTPLMAGMMFTSIGGGRIIARTGRYKALPVAGMVLMTISMGLLSTLGVTTPLYLTALYMVVLGMGMGLVMQVLILVIQNTVDWTDLGVATSAATFFRTMGGAVGVAVFGAVMNSQVRRHLTQLLGGEVSVGPSQLGSPEQIRALPGPVEQAVQEAFARGLQAVFLWSIPLALVALLLVLMMREEPLRTRETAAQQGPREESAAPVR